jgi:alkanesulfonate monooxygenase SsuD/methylene tetrahydromethanopterin reductase-like flavin-dependent oxidoreductase (luciferase family)
VLTERVPLVSAVVDTVRRHPALPAQTALTIDHLAEGRFVLGLGGRETENALTYGFDFSRPVSRFEEALPVIRLLWEIDGPVDVDGPFYSLHHARLDTEPYDGRVTRIWIGASGPRVLDIAGRHADGWWPAGAWTPERYAEMLAAVRASAERAGRDPMAITACFIQVCLIGADENALAEILRALLVKAFLLQVPAETLRGSGFDPLGPAPGRRIPLSHPEPGPGLRPGARDTRHPLPGAARFQRPDTKAGRGLRRLHLPASLDRRALDLRTRRNPRCGKVFQCHGSGSTHPWTGRAARALR